jgi:RNA polymerase primary sigma factor
MSLKELKHTYYGELAEGTARKPAPETPSSSLLAYFRDMTQNPLLTPEREVELAKEIEARETDTWIEVFSYGPVVGHLLAVVEVLLENSLREFRSLRAASTRARKSRTKGAQEALLRSAAKAAQKIRPLDLDHAMLDVVLTEIAHLKATRRGRVVRGKPSFSPAARPFRDYVDRVRQRQRTSTESRNKFVKANLGLVVSVARRYQHGGLPLTDLIQEGNLGLIKAVSRFDYRRGYRFSTYATWWIRHSIGRALADKGRTVRVPVHVLEANQRIQKTKRALAAKLGRTPTSDELAEAAEMDLDKLENTLTRAVGQSISLDAHLGEDGDRERIEVFRMPEAEDASPYDDVATRSLVSHVRGILHTLKPIEQDVIKRRFGLEGGDEVTLQEIASSYGLSRERIRQIQEQALSKVRKTLQQQEEGPLEGSADESQDSVP